MVQTIYNMKVERWLLGGPIKKCHPQKKRKLGRNRDGKPWRNMIFLLCRPNGIYPLFASMGYRRFHCVSLDSCRIPICKWTIVVITKKVHGAQRTDSQLWREFSDVTTLQGRASTGLSNGKKEDGIGDISNFLKRMFNKNWALNFPGGKTGRQPWRIMFLRRF